MVVDIVQLHVLILILIYSLTETLFVNLLFYIKTTLFGPRIHSPTSPLLESLARPASWSYQSLVYCSLLRVTSQSHLIIWGLCNPLSITSYSSPTPTPERLTRFPTQITATLNHISALGHDKFVMTA